MNIKYYEKIKKFLFCSKQQKYFAHQTCGSVCGSTRGADKKINLILNCGTSQPNLHFADQNVG